MTKAAKVGRLLADSLIKQVQSHRPVSLVGFSLGARVIYYCLLELASKGAYGIIEEVYMFGTPVVSSPSEWRKISSIVSGKIVNGYTNNDMLLGVLFRTSVASYQHVPGLSPIKNITGLENVDLTDLVNGHMEYQSKLPKILATVGFVTTADFFEDQSFEIAQNNEKHEIEKLQQKEKEKLEKLQAQIRKMEELELQKQKLKIQKQIENDRKRLEKEAILAEKKRMEEQVKRKKSNSNGGFVSKELAKDDMAADELREMVGVQDVMEEYYFLIVGIGNRERL
jgi:hypothetical protein